MTVNWNDLRIVPALVEAGSVAAAARRVGVDASTLSRRLAALEESLGARLFERTPTGLLPTEAGTAAMAAARAMEAACDSLQAACGGQDAALAGTVSLTASEGFTDLLIGMLAESRRRYPAIKVDFVSDNRTVDLFRREIDLAVRAYREEHPDLIVRTLGEAGWGLFGHVSYFERRGRPSSPHELAGHELIGYETGLKRMPGARWLAEHVTEDQIVFRSSGTRSALLAMQTGAGLAVVPTFVVPPSSEIVRVGREVLTTSTLCLVYTVEARRLARVRAVADVIQEQFAAMTEMLSGVVPP